MRLLSETLASPIGDIVVVAADGVLLGLEFADTRARMDADLRSRFGSYRLLPASNPFGISDRVRAYFAGEISVLDAVVVDAGGTPFQRRVWQALRRIPAGRTTTYAVLARRIGRPDAVRAVGAANGRNPISIVVPCHRVVGSDGSLTGYGGGLQRKEWLLRHEAAHRRSGAGGGH